MTPRVTGVRHVKIWVTDLHRSRGWYEQVFGLELSLTFEDEDGVVRGLGFRVPGADFELALRENPTLAAALDDADPFALGFRDPDGMQIRLYADDPEVAARTGGHVVSPPTPPEWRSPPRE